MREPFAITTAVSSTLHQLDILARGADAGLSVLEYDRIFGVLDKGNRALYRELPSWRSACLSHKSFR